MHEDQNLALRTVCGWCKPLSFRSSFHQPAEDMSYYKSCLLSALEAPELCPDVSGKQDPPDTCEPQTSAADKLPPGRGGCNPWQCGAQLSDRFQTRRWLFCSISGAAPSVLQAPGSSCCQQTLGREKRNRSQHIACFPLHHRKMKVECWARTGSQPQTHKMSTLPVAFDFCIKVSVPGHNHKVISIPLPSRARSDHTQEATEADAPWHQ